MATMLATSDLPSAMEGLVEDVPLRNPNLLTYNNVYSKLGNTRFLQAEPAVLNFGGYTLGQVYSQTLRIRNVRSRGIRFHILAPNSPFFKTSCPSKKGLLAPGMSEEVVVEFCPNQYRYYYDCVRVHSEDENMLVPIHAYPVANETLFPVRVDFGRVAVGQERVRKHTLQCKVPVDFEFEIVEILPHPAFKVTPTRGIVPGNGSVSVEVAFCPLTLDTAESVIEVRIAEFNSQPVRCTLIGSGWPGAARDAALADSGSIRGEGRRGGVGQGTGASGSLALTMEDLDGTATLKTRGTSLLPVNAGGGILRGGAGNGDSYTAFLDTKRGERVGRRDCRRDGPIRSRPPRLPAPPGEVTVGEVHLPADSLLLSAAEVGYVLGQERGRLSTKDVQAAISERKAALADQQRALAAALAASGGAAGEGDVHPLERPDIPPDVKAALFRQLLTEAEETARKVSLGSTPRVGQQLLTDQEVAALQRSTEERHRAHRIREEARAASRLAAEMVSSGALYLPPSAQTAPPWGEEGAATALDLTGGTLEGDEAEAAAAEAAASSSFVPEWRLIEGSEWAKRTRVRELFMRAVWKVIGNLRVQKRLERVKEVLAQLGYDKQAIAEEAANPVLLVRGTDRPGTAPTKFLRPENVRVRPLPLYRDVLFQAHIPLELTHYTDFDELAPFQLKVPLEYRLLGYSAEESPGLTPYLPPLLDQPLLAGAVEELAAAASEGLHPAATVPPLSEYPPLPDSIKNMPYITFEIGKRYNLDRVYVHPEPSYELGYDLDYVIQPRLCDMYESGWHEEVASGGVRSLRGGPALSDTWLVRQDTWAVQLGEEVVPRLMSGPDAGDLPDDRPEDDDKPKIFPQVPTDEQLARYLPNSSRSELTAAGAAGAAGPASSAPQSPPPTAGTPFAPLDTAPGRYRLVRDRHSGQLEASKAATAAANLTALEGRLVDYNALLKRPCDFALLL